MVIAMARAWLVLYKLAASIIRVLQESIGNHSKGECYAPEIKQPRCTAQSAAEKTSRTIGTWKFERLQEREQAAAYVAACESQKSTLGLDRILSKQKDGRDEVRNANYGLNHRNKRFDTPNLQRRERYDQAEHDRKENNDDQRRPALLDAGRKARNEGRNLFAFIVSQFSWCFLQHSDPNPDTGMPRRLGAPNGTASSGKDQ